VLQDVIQSMKTFSGFSNMRKLMMEVVAFTLTTTQITAIKDVFEDMDKDKSGTLDLQEVMPDSHRQIPSLAGRPPHLMVQADHLI
jgi:Ca2+-binding EF-hand superfamily protein